MKLAGHDRILLRFCPEFWTPAGKFKQFLGSPFAAAEGSPGKAKFALQTVCDHRAKYQVLASLANRLAPTLQLDLEELHENGHTTASRSSEYTAVFETMICELYAVLDGIRDSLFWLYDGGMGLQTKSTDKLFSKAKSGDYDAAFRNLFVKRQQTHTIVGFLDCEG